MKSSGENNNIELFYFWSFSDPNIPFLGKGVEQTQVIVALSSDLVRAIALTINTSAYTIIKTYPEYLFRGTFNAYFRIIPSEGLVFRVRPDQVADAVLIGTSDYLDNFLISDFNLLPGCQIETLLCGLQ